MLNKWRVVREDEEYAGLIQMLCCRGEFWAGVHSVKDFKLCPFCGAPTSFMPSRYCTTPRWLWERDWAPLPDFPRRQEPDVWEMQSRVIRRRFLIPGIEIGDWSNEYYYGHNKHQILQAMRRQVNQEMDIMTRELVEDGQPKSLVDAGLGDWSQSDGKQYRIIYGRFKYEPDWAYLPSKEWFFCRKLGQQLKGI